MCTGTQALINELASPSHHTATQFAAWMKATSKVLRLRGQQIALLRGLLQESEGQEPDVALVGKMETLAHKFDAQARILDRIAIECREFRGALRDADGLEGELKTLAAAAGYTVR